MGALIAVAVGGAAGSVARYLLAGWIGRFEGAGFPWGIMAINILGSFAMGVVVEGAALRWNLSNELRAFIAVGILGGFTTFSSFSLDAALLIQRGSLGPAAAYVLGSVALSILGLFAGLALVRALA